MSDSLGKPLGGFLLSSPPAWQVYKPKFCGKKVWGHLDVAKKSSRETFPASSLVGWHLCRTKLPWKAFHPKRNVIQKIRKLIRNLPEKFWAKMFHRCFLVLRGQTWCISKKGVVYKLHAGWFINHTQGEFVNWCILSNLRVFSVEILQKEGNVKDSMSGRQAVYKCREASFWANICHFESQVLAHMARFWSEMIVAYFYSGFRPLFVHQWMCVFWFLLIVISQFCKKGFCF